MSYAFMYLLNYMLVILFFSSPSLSPLSQVSHFKDSNRQSYHPMTPHATLITPLATSTPSSSAQWVGPGPANAPPNHFNSFTQQQFMYPTTQEGRGFNMHAPPLHTPSRRQSLDPKMIRLLEQQQQQMWGAAGYAQSQLDYIPPSGLHPSHEGGGYRGSKSQLHFGSTGGLNFLSQGSKEDEEETKLGLNDYNTDLDTHSMQTLMGGGGGGSQMGPMVAAGYHATLASQEFFDHTPHMPFPGDMYQMSQPDMLLYHQRNGAYPLPPSSRGGVKQQAPPTQMSKMEKHMSLTDVSSLADAPSSHSRSITTLHEGAESSWGVGLRPMKPYQRSQGALSITDLPPNQHGPPGLTSTMAARLAAPLNQSNSPRPVSGRRVVQNHKQSRHPRLQGGQQALVQPLPSEVPREGMQQQHRGVRGGGESTPRADQQREKRREEEKVKTTTTAASRESSPPPSSMTSLSQSPPDSIILTQTDQSQHQQPPKLRSSSRR